MADRTIRRTVRLDGEGFGPDRADELDARLSQMENKSDTIDGLKRSGAIEGDGWGKGSKGERAAQGDKADADPTLKAGKVAARRRKLMEEQAGGGETKKRSGRAKKAGKAVKTGGDDDTGNGDADALPDDFPHRGALESAGVSSLSSLRDQRESLTDLDGIGDAKATEIADALDNLDEQNDEG